jgi:hypothetical protein
MTRTVRADQLKPGDVTTDLLGPGYTLTVTRVERHSTRRTRVSFASSARMVAASTLVPHAQPVTVADQA